MELQKIRKAEKYLKEINLIDCEIKQIEDMANTLANKKSEVKLSLSVEDLEKKENPKCEFDEDGSLVKSGGVDSVSFRFEASNPWGLPVYKVEPNITFGLINNFTVSETEALQILGVLIYSKQTRRKYLMDKINNL